MKATTGTVLARLYNLTDGTPVIGSDLSTSSLSFVRLRSGVLTLTDGKEYVAQKGKVGLNAGELQIAELIGVLGE